jgi:formamidopyrimidine-DNA glycosylase
VPELPEVEQAARTLRRHGQGRRIEAVALDARARRMLRPASPAEVTRALTGARIERVERRGKQLLLTLATPGGPLGLLSHLGMSGEWVGVAAGAPPSRHARVSLRLDDGAALHLDDPRMFGRLRLVPGARFDLVPEVAALGPDPVADALDAAALARVLAPGLAASRRPIKVALLDQRLLAGVGNIHAAEACWRARLDPRRRADRLAAAEVRALARAILASLAHGLAALERGPVVYLGAGGENDFHVYGRAAQACPHRGCGGVLRRILQAQRATFFCPRCQR